MRAQSGWILTAALIVGACSAALPDRPVTAQSEGVPDSIVALAAPNQDVQSARLLPEDGCYWYSYAGPVETTLLPLRTVDGRRICVPQAA
nr:hypothetical protein [uncultured Paracoccus sp.]